MIIRFTPEADAELAEARQWYAHQHEDLDIEFMERIDDVLSRIIRWRSMEQTPLLKV
jgi:hypothetical protein